MRGPVGGVTAVCVSLAVLGGLTACTGPGPGQRTSSPTNEANPTGPPVAATEAPTDPAGGVATPDVTVAPAAAAPPAWLAAGVRLTWYVAAASVANSGYSIVEDPAGNYEDPRTGKRYRRTDAEGGEGQPGASGDGYSQVDIVGFDGQRAALSMSLYGLDRLNNSYVLTPIDGAIVDATRVDGAWVSPTMLTNAIEEGFGDLLLLRGPYKIGETTYDSLSFVSGLGTSTSSSYTFDLATGILVSTNTSTGGVASPFHIEGEAPPVGNSQLTMARFLGMRPLAVPGVGTAAPDWVGRTTQMTYNGTYTWTNPLDPASGSLVSAMQHVVSFQPGGANWVAYTARTVVPQMAIDNSLHGVSGATGLYWYAPQALGQMAVGQVLDADPITGEQVSVADNRGGQVVLESRASGLYTRLVYDVASGQLVGFDSQQAAVTISVQLVDSR